MNCICFLLPSVLFCYASKKLSRKNDAKVSQRIMSLLLEYLTGALLINGILVFTWFILGYDGIAIDDLNFYSSFAVKYIIGAIVLALILPYILIFIKKRLNLETPVNTNRNLNSKRDLFYSIMIIIFTIFMGAIHLIRCFNYCFWLDEGYTVVAARKGFYELINYVVFLGHSPFQYLVESLAWHVFGESGFLFHFASTLPFFFVLAVSATIVRKWFGNIASILLTTLSSLLECAIIYNLEVRMYAWCEFFILMVFLMNYGVYATNRRIYYVLMALFSLGAVYSHYFALASVGLIYLVLFLYKIFRRQYLDVMKVAISGGSVLLLLAVWLIIAKMIKGSVFSNPGIWIISWRSCFEFIFHSDYSFFLLSCFIVATLYSVFSDFGFIKIGKNSDGKIRLIFQKPVLKRSVVDKWTWEFGGIFGVLATIVFAQLFSSLVAPITHLRYLYISFVIIWLLFSINISSFKYNKLIALTLVVFIFLTCVPKYCSMLAQERDLDQRLKKTLYSTREIGRNDCIYTNMMDIYWTLADVYYPSVRRKAFGNPTYGTPEMLELDDACQGWLFLSSGVAEDVQKYLSDHGKVAKMIDDGIMTIDNGLFGMETVYIYKIVELENETIDRGTIKIDDDQTNADPE